MPGAQLSGNCVPTWTTSPGQRVIDDLLGLGQDLFEVRLASKAFRVDLVKVFSP